ncbi:MAG: hypothetical protein ACQESK_03300 [Bacteroidota bacterium]
MAFFLCLMFFAQTIFAQQKTTESKIALNDTIVGVAEFQYVLSKKDTVYDGFYRFNSTKKDSLKTEVLYALGYEGNYQSNKKSGDWSFSRKKLQAGENFSVEGYQVSYPADGEEFLVKGDFTDGKATGDWSVVNHTFLNGKRKDTLYYLQTSFENSKMVNRLEGFSNQIEIEGQFTADGLLDGDWVLNHDVDGKNLKEVRVYESGVFKSHYFDYEGETYAITHTGLDTTVDEGEDNWEELEIDQGYFQIFELSGYNLESVDELGDKNQLNKIINKSNQFIKSSLLSFGRYDDYQIWKPIKGNKGIEFGKFKVRKFAYSTEEKQALNQLSEDFEEIQQLLSKYHKNSKIQLGKVSFKELIFYEKIFSIYRSQLDEINEMQRKINLPAFEYVNRQRLFPDLAPELQFPEEISYKFKDENYSEKHDFPTIPAKKKYNIIVASKLINNIHQDVKKISLEVEKLIKKLEKQEELSENEEELVAKKEQLENYFNETENEDFNTYHNQLKEVVVGLVNQVFEDYGEMNLDDKKDQIDESLACYDALLNLNETISNLPKRVNRLDDVYTRTTFNPHMMVDMDERIKERVYTAYEKYLFPYMLNRLEQELSCKQIDAAILELNNLYDKMISLSDQDTSSIERKLKREKDPQKILEILGLELKY